MGNEHAVFFHHFGAPDQPGAKIISRPTILGSPKLVQAATYSENAFGPSDDTGVVILPCSLIVGSGAKSKIKLEDETQSTFQVYIWTSGLPVQFYRRFQSHLFVPSPASLHNV